jgi:hypothetical protein
MVVRVAFDVDVNVNSDEQDNDGDDPTDAHHFKARSCLGVWFVEV